MKNRKLVYLLSLLLSISLVDSCITDCLTCPSGVCDQCNPGFYLLVNSIVESCYSQCPTNYYNGTMKFFFLTIGVNNTVLTCLQQTSYQAMSYRDPYSNVVYIISPLLSSTALFTYLSQTLKVYYATSGVAVPFSLAIRDTLTVSATLSFPAGVNYNELITFNYVSNYTYNYVITPSVNISTIGYYPLSESGADILKYYNYVIKYAMIALQFKALVFIIFGGGKLVSPIQTYFYLNLIEVFKFMNIAISPIIDDFLRAVDSDMFLLVQEYIQTYVLTSNYYNTLSYQPTRFAYYARKLYLSDYFGLGLIISGLAFLTWLSVRIMKQAHIIQSESNKYLMSLEWNQLLSLFYAFSLKLILASALQLYNYSFDDLYSIVNTSLSIFFIVLYILVFCILILRTVKVKRIMELSGTILGRDNIYFAKKFRLLFYDFSVKDTDSVWYLQVHFFRYFFIVPMLIWVQSVPLIQFFAFVSGNILVLIFLIKFRPFRERINLWTAIFNEIVILLMIGFYAAFYNFQKNSSDINTITYTGFAYMGTMTLIILCESVKGIIEIIGAFLKLADDKKIVAPRAQKIYPIKSNAKENAKDQKI